jgi:hypothetical protein
VLLKRFYIIRQYLFSLSRLKNTSNFELKLLAEIRSTKNRFIAFQSRLLLILISIIEEPIKINRITSYYISCCGHFSIRSNIVHFKNKDDGQSVN